MMTLVPRLLAVALAITVAGCPTPEAVDAGGGVSGSGNGSAVASKDAAQRAEQAMRALADADAPEGVESAVEPGPMGIEVARAMRVGSYPGTGVFRVVVADGLTYGARGERDLADLARARGWHKTPPSSDDLFRIVSAAQHDGLLMKFEGRAPNSELIGGDLVLTAVLGEPFGEASYDFKVTLPVQGSLTSSKVRRAAPTPKPAGTKLGSVAALTAALASHDSMDILDAVKALKGNTSADRLGPLAAAAVLDNDRIATTALTVLGSDAQALTALKSAAASLSPAERTKLTKRVTATLGEAAAKRL